MRSSSTEGAPVPAARMWAFAALAMLLGIAGFLIAAEIVFRFLPVASGLRSVAVNAANPVFHFEPNGTYTYSLTWRMDYVQRGRVNNAGFVNDQDYRKDGAPLIAVVGDSFIEAQMVPYAETLQGRLAQSLGGFRVYSFAASGAPLSQYLIWARHAVRDYGARAVVINVVVNDFDESHVAYAQSPGFWIYVPDDTGTLQLRLQPLHHGLMRMLARQSALARYLLINLRLGYYLQNEPWLQSLFFRRAFAQSPNADALRLERSSAVIDAFLRDLPRMVELPKDRILLIVDGYRDPDLKSASEGSYFDRMRKALLERANRQGYEAIDLDPIFLARHRATGERFDFPTDPHWNRNGHAVATEAVLGSRMLRAVREGK